MIRTGRLSCWAANGSCSRPDGERLVIEGDKIVGETPSLSCGESFTYNSYHVTGCNARVVESFHEFDETGQRIHVILDPFDMAIPELNPDE